MAKSKSAKDASALERSPSHLLHRAVQLALDVYAEEMGAGAITQRQFAVLAAVAEHDGATQTDLVRLTGIDRSTMAEMAARLIAKGLLERRRSPFDARANAVSLTDAGRATLEAARPKMAAADARLLKLISGGGRRQAFVGLLQDLIAGAEAQARKRGKAETKPVAGAKSEGAEVVSVEALLKKKKKKAKKEAA
ncbi:MarR family transcriptional regulator [Phenylobacterium sp. LjRoot219]|uniref:MarR family winged helix-turn-helix transcriptional regulator n=1 Tax=Phenylobacterium sp. LjRoot219 TaxID=3342283 RepID=UPI003ED094D2